MDYCDLVMKGGITSGVVYPLAAVELSKKYHFRNIGGTSAGAIAAAATAAAEYRRRTGSDDGFAALGRLPDVLGRKGFLLSLFQPDPVTAPLFRVVFSLMNTRGAFAIVASVLRGLITGYTVPALVGATLGAIVPALLWYAGVASLASASVLGSIWVALFAIVAAATSASRGVPALLHRNRFGLCSGYDAGAPVGQPPLTNWLYGFLNDVAGKPADAPLTFGDLWHAPQPHDPIQSERAINLEMMTTNLTHGRPYSLPFGDTVSRQFYYSPDEWNAYFPPAVLAHLRAHVEVSGTSPRTEEGLTLAPLPAMADLPIVVAVRMSLGFPVLFAAVPLWAVDYSRTMNQQGATPPVAERCWFSDGGISSNFPLRFFDSPLPRWPTFGMNLKTPHPDHQTESEFVWLPSSNGQGLQPSWNRFDDGPSGKRLVGFFSAIVDTMQNWRDNMESRMPGYRNRIVHISQRDDEGALNLDMEREVIERLSERGRLAGERLRDKFDWDNHAWVRYRSYAAALEVNLGQFKRAYEHPAPQDERIWPTIRGEAEALRPPSYRWSSGGQAAFAKAFNTHVVELASTAGQPPRTVTAGAPRPEPELRLTPKT